MKAIIRQLLYLSAIFLFVVFSYSVIPIPTVNIFYLCAVCSDYKVYILYSLFYNNIQGEKSSTETRVTIFRYALTGFTVLLHFAFPLLPS